MPLETFDSAGRLLRSDAVGITKWARLERTTNLALAPGNSQISWDSVVADNDAIFDSAQPKRLTARTAGTYIVVVRTNVIIVLGGSNERKMVLNKNGAQVAEEIDYVTAAGRLGRGIVSLAQLAAGDYMTLDMYNAGTADQVLIGGDHESFFAMARIAQAGVVLSDDAGSIGDPNVQAANYQLTLADAGRVIEMNAAGATVVTVPAHADVPFPVGTIVEISREGAGAVTIAAAAGVTLHSRGELRAIGNQYGPVTLRKRAANDWRIAGDMA